MNQQGNQGGGPSGQQWNITNAAYAADFLRKQQEAADKAVCESQSGRSRRISSGPSLLDGD